MAPLTELINIGPKTAGWLAEMGIVDRKSLADLGPVDAYRLLTAAGYPTSPVLLYALYGALNNLHWQLVPEVVKSNLKARAGL